MFARGRGAGTRWATAPSVRDTLMVEQARERFSGAARPAHAEKGNKIRNPKELRNPKPEKASWLARVNFGFRISGFGFLSDFGLRISVF
jgi:hypothetical protein